MGVTLDSFVSSVYLGGAMDDLLHLQASFFPYEKKKKKKEPRWLLRGKDGMMPGAMEFVISRLAD